MRLNVLDNTQRSHGLNVTDPGVIDAMLNDAYSEICEKCRLTEKSITITFPTAGSDYSLITDLAVTDLVHIRTLYSTILGPLPELSPEQLLDGRRSALAANGYAQAYALLGTDTLMMLPAQSAGATAILLYGVAPPIMGPTDSPSLIPSGLHHALELIATARAIRTKDWRAGARIRREADEAIKEIRAYMNRRSGVGGQHLRGGSQLRFVRSSPSQDDGR